MPRYKIGGNTYYSKDEKLRIVKKVVEEGKSSYDVAKEENISSSGMIRRWVKIYIENGYDALEMLIGYEDNMEFCYYLLNGDKIAFISASTYSDDENLYDSLEEYTKEVVNSFKWYK